MFFTILIALLSVYFFIWWVRGRFIPALIIAMVSLIIFVKALISSIFFGGYNSLMFIISMIIFILSFSPFFMRVYLRSINLDTEKEVEDILINEINRSRRDHISD